MSTTLHAFDLVAWARDSAVLLRQGENLDADRREQIADELEAMAGRDRRELSSRTVTLIMHLLKIHYQPQKRSRSWDLTVVLQRGEIRDLLRESPSLKQIYSDDLPDLYARAKQAAEAETGADSFPEKIPFTLDQILNG